MARHQTTVPWVIEMMEAAAIFLAAIFMGALAAVGLHRNPTSAVALLGGLPAVVFVVIGCRVCSAALRNRSRAAGHDDVESSRQGQRAFIGIPAAAIARIEDGGDGGGEEECAVCLCAVEDVDDADQKALRVPGCRHVFHRECLARWLRFHWTCPICRHFVRYLPSSPATASQHHAAS
uniref:RING-type E3 ubiquitin transferase n=1 Tax=Leersia perrieri TaxID=77586 RepID=A0A0D9WQY3_9ORYZ